MCVCVYVWPNNVPMIFERKSNEDGDRRRGTNSIDEEDRG